MSGAFPRRPIRWLLIGLVCYLGGVTSHVAFRLSPVTDSIGDALKAGFQFVWFAVGMLLIAIDLRHTAGKRRWVGWALLGIAALAAWVMVANAFPDK